MSALGQKRSFVARLRNVRLLRWPGFRIKDHARDLLGKRPPGQGRSHIRIALLGKLQPQLFDVADFAAFRDLKSALYYTRTVSHAGAAVNLNITPSIIRNAYPLPGFGNQHRLAHDR
jgi:hypothetical protein